MCKSPIRNGICEKHGKTVYWGLLCWDTGFKLKEDRFKLGIRKKLFTMRVADQWNREVVDALSLETFRVMLDRTLSHLISLKVFLLIAEG